MNPVQKQTSKLNDYIAKMKSDYESVFSSPAGQRVVEDIKKSAFIYKTSFNTDALMMAKNEGKREIALNIEFMATIQKELAEENKTAITGEKK